MPGTRTRPPFVFEAQARPIKATRTSPARLGAWTDGVCLDTEESPEDRRLGFIPAYRLRLGRRYRITIEELP